MEKLSDMNLEFSYALYTWHSYVTFLCLIELISEA